MEEILNVIDQLENLVAEVPERFGQFTAEEIDYKPGPAKWSKKEILGHLCDSCLHNIQRIIRVQYEEKPFIIYNQDEWVKNQDYQNRAFEEVLSYWIALHQQFIYALKQFPESRLESIIDCGTEVTARFVITDYPDHQLHHLNQIFPK